MSKSRIDRTERQGSWIAALSAGSRDRRLHAIMTAQLVVIATNSIVLVLQ